jgi:hypothetical protein
MSVEFLDANKVIRDAVHNRLAGTPADDPKMVGYAPQQEAEDRMIDSFLQQFNAASEALPARKTHPVSEQFFALLEELEALHGSKSADYGSETDPLANIRQGAEFVNIEAWRGCLVRIADKVQRLRTYCRTGRLVHEGVRDTLLDLANYSLLAIILHDEANG